MHEQPDLYVVGEKEPRPINVAETLSRAQPECFSRIEAMEYAGAFNHFAEQLESLETNLKNSFFEEAAQKQVRQNLKQLWDIFLKDIKDPKKKTSRLNALQEQTEKNLVAVQARRQDEQMQYDQLPDEQKKYYHTLARQKVEKGPVATFPNEASQQEDFKRKIYNFIDDSIGAPIEEAYAPELEYMGYIGALFNDVLPFLRERMEGYVKPLIVGKRNYSNYLPVSATIVRANIVTFLEQASNLAKAVAELQKRRDEVNESTRKKLLGE